MGEASLLPRAGIAARPRFSAMATEDLLLGGRRLRQAFLQTPLRFAGRDGLLLKAGAAEPAAILIRNGFAFYSCLLGDGHRAMLRVLVSGDFAGLDSIVLARATEDIYAANRAGYHLLGMAALRELTADFRSRCSFWPSLPNNAGDRTGLPRASGGSTRMPASACCCSTFTTGCGTAG